MKGDKMFESYALYIGDNEEEIINEFCDKIRKELIGDLTLDEYSRFRFWKNHTVDELKHFYKKFKKETKSDMNYNRFCELMWNTLDNVDDIPDEIKDMIEALKGLGNEVGRA